ncbi:MAG: anaerobic sulfatase maturase [Rhodobacteraceae bacterium]|nr:anaerobic sulfatase maturase [Paracoccaceae bacterium]
MQQTAAPYHLLAKPAGAACNLGCDYCFFLSKENLYPDESYLMTPEMQESYIRQLLESSPGEEVQIAWQGGEPTLRGLDFFKRSVELAERYRKPGQRVLHTVQTNGTLIDDAWAAFLKANNFLVGISIDGPRPMHDAFRVTKKGAGSFDDVIRGWETLRRHDVDVNILCTINAANAGQPLEVYRFFRDVLGARFIQLIPIVERATAETIEIANLGWGGQHGRDRPLYTQAGSLVTRRTVTAEAFGAFLNAIFDEWVVRDVGQVYVTTFDIALGSWLGQHNACIVAPTCGRSLALEHNGDVYSCDHFVEPAYLLGNIDSAPLRVLIESEQQRRFGEAKFEALPKYCRECPVLFACYGECPRNRFIDTPDGEPGLNWLCAGYKAFFTHIGPKMEAMANLLREGRYADEIMTIDTVSPSAGSGV